MATHPRRGSNGPPWTPRLCMRLGAALRAGGGHPLQQAQRTASADLECAATHLAVDEHESSTARLARGRSACSRGRHELALRDMADVPGGAFGPRRSASKPLGSAMN